jgi:hypothetical protein
VAVGDALGSMQPTAPVVAYRRHRRHQGRASSALAEHLARQPEDGLDPAATIAALRARARLALAEAMVDMLESFRTQDEAAEQAFHDRVKKLAHGRGTVEATLAWLRGAAKEAADAIWALAIRVEELERRRASDRRG